MNAICSISSTICRVTACCRWINQSLHSLLETPGDELHRLIEAIFVLTAVRAALWLAPYARIQQWIDSTGRRASRRHHPFDANSEKIISAIERSAHYVPRATCLTRAMAAQFLLARNGTLASLRLGVSLRPTKRLKAHAWLESGGAIVLGGDIEGIEAFKPLPVLT